MGSREEYTFERIGFTTFAKTSEEIFGHHVRIASEIGQVVCIFRLGAFLERKSEADRAVRALIQMQRRLATSPQFSTRLRILWVAAMLDERLALCSDGEIGELMAIVQDRFHIFDPEFAVCYHARRRLLLRTIMEDSLR